MIDFFDRLCFWGDARRFRILNRLRIYALVRNISIYLANIILPLYFKVTAKQKKNKILFSETDKAPEYIVSLTTFPLRISSVWLVIESMLHQSYKPDKVVLYLSKKQFSGFDVLPKNLLNLQKRGLQIEFVDKDMRSHKKYLYAMEKYPDANVITVDDDVIYRSDFVQSMVCFSKKFPGSIIGNRCKVTSSSVNYCYNVMRDATPADSLIPRDDLLNIGASGVLYPPGSLFQDWNNHELIERLCFTADDIWLHCMAKMQGTKVVFSNYFQNQLLVKIKNNVSLRDVNLEANQIQIEALIKYYKEHFGRNPFESVNAK